MKEKRKNGPDPEAVDLLWEIDPNEPPGLREEEDTYQDHSGDLDGVRLYLREIDGFPLLTEEQERELGKRAAEGDENARRRMMESNLRLVVSIAKHYANHGVPFSDLIQEGNLGLLKAVERFDYRKGCRFSTYAFNWIRQEIVRSALGQEQTIYLPQQIREKARALKKMEERLAQGTEKTSDEAELAETMKISREEAALLRRCGESAVSLDAPTEEGTLLKDLVPDDGRGDPVLRTEREDLRRRVREAVARLPDREQRVLLCRFGLLDGREWSLAELGEAMGMTREGVRKIERRALDRIAGDAAVLALRGGRYND